MASRKPRELPQRVCMPPLFLRIAIRVNISLLLLLGRLRAGHQQHGARQREGCPCHAES
jgi:hypothetical protein